MTQAPKPQFLLLFRHPRTRPARTAEEAQRISATWIAWMKAIKDKGQLLASNRLPDGGQVLRSGATTDGPLVENQEIVGGFLIIAADSLDQATKIGRACPGLSSDNWVEVRPIEPIAIV